MSQGSTLGPFLFLLYINDIVKNIGPTIHLFADDTRLFIIVDNPTITALCLNSDLEKLSLWAAIWLGTFNPKASKNEFQIQKATPSTSIYAKCTNSRSFLSQTRRLIILL